MMFKYRGTTIRLFSTKLFILALALSAIFAVFSLHEVVSPNYSNQRTSHRNISSGFEINPPLQTLQLHGQGVVLASVTTKIDAIQNINNVPQEKRIDEILRPTFKISPNNSKSPEIRKLREIVRSVNLKESMRNKDKFGTDFSQSSLVIIIQVHDRVDYFSHLLKSLSHAKGIERALLIISSDFYSEEINRLVEEINFCRVSATPLVNIFTYKMIVILCELMGFIEPFLIWSLILSIDPPKKGRFLNFFLSTITFFLLVQKELIISFLRFEDSAQILSSLIGHELPNLLCNWFVKLCITSSLCLSAKHT